MNQPNTHNYGNQLPRALPYSAYASERCQALDKPAAPILSWDALAAKGWTNVAGQTVG